MRLEAKEFYDRQYFSDSEISGGCLKWVSDPRKIRKRCLHFMHSISPHHQLETLLNMVIRDKQTDNYKLFVGYKEIKQIMRDIGYNLDNIAVRLNQVERYIASEFDFE